MGNPLSHEYPELYPTDWGYGNNEYIFADLGTYESVIPHRPDAVRVFEAADQFKRRCLLDQTSLFLEQEIIWTTTPFEALINHYVKQPDVGEGSFYEKLAGQLVTCKPLDIAPMTEVFWIVQRGPKNLRPPPKVEMLKRIWNIKPQKY